MPDLSAYLDFSVELDCVTNKIKITDTSNYPVGVNTGIIGILEITQPDEINIEGDWANPDIEYSGGALTVGERDLRMDSDNNPQGGTYTVTYTVDHASYTPTTKTKTFILSYTRKTLDLSEDFDVFTPSLFYRDLTVFTQAGFNTTSNVVAWAATIGTVGSTTGSSSNFDLVYGGDYYDAAYTITYQRDLLYTHQTYTYLTLRDRYTESISTTADTPPSVNDIVGCLNDLKAELDAAAGNCTVTDPLEERYQKAVVRYDHLIHQLQTSNTDNPENLLEEVLDLTRCSHTVYRNTIIAPYDLSSYASGGGGGSLYYDYTIPSDVTEVTLVAMNGKTIGSIALNGIIRRFSNGLDTDTPDSDTFIVVTGSTPRKFKYGGTLTTDSWIQISYS